MKIENIDIKKITKYSKNYKIHDERQINLISESIKKFGFRNPVLIDSNNVIIAGHGRVMGAEKLGLKEVPCILVDNLSEEEIKAYRIADNKLAELAKDDMELLSLELKEIEGLDLDFKLDILGIDDDYYEELMEYGDNERECETIEKDLSNNQINNYEIIIECDNEEELEKNFEILKGSGYKCRISTL